MKILYLGNDKRHCTERYVSYALAREGCTVSLLDIRRTTRHYVRELVKEMKPDFVLFSKPSAVWVPKFLEECRERGVPTACWLWDLYWGYRPARPPQFDADHLFTTDGGHENLWREHYPHHRVLRQGVHEPEAVAFWDQEPKWDVGFVGSVFKTHRGRRQLLAHLTERYGSRFKLITDVRGLDLNRLLGQIKIVVGDSYPTPHYWSNRIYEVLGRGGFLLYPETEGLDEEFTAGVHYAPFVRGDWGDLDQRVDRYLTEEGPRLQIRRLGHELVRRRYRYQDRVGSLLEAVRGRQTTTPIDPVRAAQDGT